MSASLDAGTSYGRIHNSLRNADGVPSLNIHATTDYVVTGNVRRPRITNSGLRSGSDASRNPGSSVTSASSAAAISTRASGAPTQ